MSFESKFPLAFRSSSQAAGGEWPGESESRILRDMHHSALVPGRSTPTKSATMICDETTGRSFEVRNVGLNDEALGSTETSSPASLSHFATGPSLDCESTTPVGSTPARNATETKKAQIVCGMECRCGENMVT